TKLVDAEPETLVTVQVTVVAPIGNVSPETTTLPSASSHTGVPPVAVTVNVTGAPAAEVASTVMSPGPAIVGASGQAGSEIVASVVSVSPGREPPFGVTVAEFVSVTGSPQALSFVTRIESPMFLKLPSAAATVSGKAVVPTRVQVKPAGHEIVSVSVAVSLPSAGSPEA